MAQQGRIVGIDVSKLKANACIRSLQLGLSKPSTPQGEQELIAWLRDNGVGLAVMEASGGYERGWAQALRQAGIAALHRAIEGVSCTTAVHICYGYGIKANVDWKATLGSEWRQYEAIFPALAQSRIDQVSVECAGAKVPLDLLRLLQDKEVLLGAIDVASERVETPEEVAATIEQASRFVPVERLYPCTNCGMAPMDRSLAISKLAALSAGAALARG